MLQAILKGDAAGMSQYHTQIFPATKMHNVQRAQSLLMEATGKAPSEGMRIAAHSRSSLKPL